MHWRQIKQELLLLFTFFLIISCFNSCAPTKCVLCELNNTKIYKIKLKKEGRDQIGKDKVFTNYYPITIKREKNNSEIYIVDCESKEPYFLKGKELEDFIRENLVIIDKSKVDTIIDTGDSDSPPRINMGAADTLSLKLCNRFRQPLKIELRGMFGVRDFLKEGKPIPGYGTSLDKKVLGFGGGGTNLVVGAEAGLLPRIAKIGLKGSLNLGLMTGFWPVDSGMFIPVAIHPKLTFNEFTSPLWGQCNAWNIFCDLGVAYDVSGKVDFLKDNNLPYSWFYDIGAGIDLWRSRNLDLSFDLGFRRTNLALPISQEYSQCVDNNGNIVKVTGFPVRSIGQLFLRFCLTF